MLPSAAAYRLTRALLCGGRSERWEEGQEEGQEEDQAAHHWGSFGTQSDCGARFVERVNLRVRLTRPLVGALSKHNAVVRDDAGAHQRVGRGTSQPAPGMRDRPPHPLRVVYHFAWNSAST